SRLPAAFIRAAPITPTRRSLGTVPAAAAGLPRAVWRVAARGTPAVTIRCPDGYPTPRPAAHLRLLGAHALGRVGSRESPEAAAAGAGRAAAARHRPRTRVAGGSAHGASAQGRPASSDSL